MEGKKFNQFSYQNDFISKNYDRVNLTVPKGKKEKIREAAKAEGKSVNESTPVCLVPGRPFSSRNRLQK